MKITNSISFGEMIKKRRKQLGYTQKYLSEFTGISVSFLSDLEKMHDFFNLLVVHPD